jgi:hypothetical protein
LNSVMAGEKTKANVLKLVLGETQLESARGRQTDPVKIIRKLIESNETSLKSRYDNKLVMENDVLRSYLPDSLSFETLEGLFLNSDGPEVELIQDAKNEGSAIGVAMQFVKRNNLVVDNPVVVEVVNKFRGSV